MPPNQKKSEIIRIKKAVRERDGNRCVRCGIADEDYRKIRGRSLDVHRKIAGSVYTVEHSQTMCQPCHGRLPKTQRGVDQAAACDRAGLEHIGIQYVLLMLTKEQHAMLKEAARRSGMPMTKFFTESTVAAAEEILGERRPVTCA